MTIGVSIVHFVIKVPKLVQIIVTIYRVQAYQVPIINQRWPQKSNLAAKKVSFWTFQSDFPRIIEIALLLLSIGLRISHLFPS